MQIPNKSLANCNSSSYSATPFIQAQPNLLVSDIGMPEMDGYTLIRQIHRLPQNQQTRAIALTVYAREINHRQAIAAEF